MRDKKLYIAYECFWQGFDVDNNPFTDMLKMEYDVTIITEPSDYHLVNFVFYSCFGNRLKVIERYPTAVKIYVSGENDVPDFNFCDYSISHCPYLIGQRNIRYPIWCVTYYGKDIASMRVNESDYDSSLFNREFCSFVVSNNNNAIPMRTTIFNVLNDSISKVASGGAYLNNIGCGRVDNKNAFISNYKFNIAAENSFVEGYVTEKIVDAFVSRTVPIYMGDKMVKEDFNENAFINVTDYPTYRDLVEAVKNVMTHENVYMDMLCAPIFYGQNNQKFYNDRLKYFLYAVVEENKPLIHTYGRQGLKLANNKIIC